MGFLDDLFYQQIRNRQQREEAHYRAMQAMVAPNPYGSPMGLSGLGSAIGVNPEMGASYLWGSSVNTVSPQEKFQTLKKSVKDIEAEPFNDEARRHIEDKINRLHSAGAVAQASILAQEIRTRQSLVRLKEWDYKILTKETIVKFQQENQVTHTRDGLKVHIDPLDKYCGNPQIGEAKDRIMPDQVLEKLEEANERELFDDVAVLYVEKVKDPLLLGIVEGCEDYFFIAEWGEDVSFEQISKGE